jgi:hypothetical protein
MATPIASLHITLSIGSAPRKSLQNSVEESLEGNSLVSNSEFSGEMVGRRTIFFAVYVEAAARVHPLMRHSSNLVRANQMRPDKMWRFGQKSTCDPSPSHR